MNFLGVPAISHMTSCYVWMKMCLWTVVLRLQPNSLNPKHEHTWPEPVFPTTPLVSLLSLTSVSGLTFTLGISAPLPLVLKLEKSCWPCLTSSLISVKSLTAMSLNFLLCEMRITIRTYYYSQNWRPSVPESIIHPFHTFIGNLPAWKSRDKGE